MKIYDKDFTEIMDYQPDMGWIQEATRTIHHPAIEGRAEEGHYETIREYPETGGKDVRWVVDVPGIKAQDAYDEEENYYLFTPWTDEELEQIQKDREKPTAEELLQALMEGIANA